MGRGKASDIGKSSQTPAPAAATARKLWVDRFHRRPAKSSMRRRLLRHFARPRTLVNGNNKEEAVTHGNFAWHELYTRDVAKAGDKPVAGVLDMRGIVPDTDPPHWLSYLEVDDVDRLVAEVQSHGGRIVRRPFDVPEFGRIAIGADATGAFMAWATLKR
jgi:hypothetical protein